MLTTESFVRLYRARDRRRARALVAVPEAISQTIFIRD